MHRMADIAILAQIYSRNTDEAKDEALEMLRDYPGVLTSANNLGIKGRKEMERTGRSNNIAATTKDMRDIAREAHRHGLNRRMKPAQFKLLDPRGTHILSPMFFHDRADEKLTEMHVRCHVHLKLLGKQKALELTMDVPMEFIQDYLTGQEKLDLMERALQQGSVENLDDTPVPDKEPTMINVNEISQGNEATPNTDKMSAEGNS